LNRSLDDESTRSRIPVGSPSERATPGDLWRDLYTALGDSNLRLAQPFQVLRDSLSASNLSSERTVLHATDKGLRDARRYRSRNIDAAVRIDLYSPPEKPYLQVPADPSFPAFHLRETEASRATRFFAL